MQKLILRKRNLLVKEKHHYAWNARLRRKDKKMTSICRRRGPKNETGIFKIDSQFTIMTFSSGQKIPFRSWCWTETQKRKNYPIRRPRQPKLSPNRSTFMLKKNSTLQKLRFCRPEKDILLQMLDRGAKNIFPAKQHLRNFASKNLFKKTKIYVFWPTIREPLCLGYSGHREIWTKKVRNYDFPTNNTAIL